MYIYILLVLYFLLGNLIIKNKKKFCIISCILLIFVVGLRNFNIGRKDTTLLYLPVFNVIKNYSFADLLLFIRTRDTEFLFYLYSFIIGKLFNNNTIYLLSLCIPVYIILCRHIYKYSNNVCMSFIILLSLNYFCWSFYMLRHVLALSILVLAYEAYLENNNKKFLLYVALATGIHRTAILFLLIFLMKKINLNKIILIISAFSFHLIIMFFGRNIINWFLLIFFNSGHFSYYVSNLVASTNTVFLINFIILIFLSIFKNHEKDEYFFNGVKMQFLACIFSSLALVISESMRIASFFSIASICTIPFAISKIQDKKTKFFINVFLYIILIVYFLLFSLENNNLIPYSFFWEV